MGAQVSLLLRPTEDQMLTYFERYKERGWSVFDIDDVEQALIRKCHAQPVSTLVLPEGQLEHEIDPLTERYRRLLTITDTKWLESVTPSCDFVDNDLAALSHPESPREGATPEESLRFMVGEEHEYGLRLTVLLKVSLERELMPSGYINLGWIGSRHVGSLIEAMSGFPDNYPEDPRDESFRRYLGLLVRHGLI